MISDKIYCMKIAKKYRKDYWDGDRKLGYGGYRYIKIDEICSNQNNKKYKLSNKSKILDVGCGKGFLLYEIKKILPKVHIVGIDISKYGLKFKERNQKIFV